MTPATQATARPADEVRPQRSLPAAGWLAWYSLREMIRRRRLVALGLICLLPVLMVLAVRIWFSNAGVTTQMMLAALSHDVFMPFLIPVVALFVGVPAIGEQVDDGTIVFTWTRPVRRRAIYLGRLLAAQSVSALVLCFSLALCLVVMVSQGAGVLTWEFIRLYLQTMLIIVLGVATYAALFAAMGTYFKKPIPPALMFAVGWENLVTNIPARVQELSLRFHLQNLITQPAESPKSLPGLLGALLSTAFHREPVPKVQSVAVLVGVMLASAALGVWLFRRKEIAK